MKNAQNAAAVQFAKAFLAGMGLPNWDALNQATQAAKAATPAGTEAAKVVDAALEAAAAAAAAEKEMVEAKPSLIKRIGAGIAKPFVATWNGIKAAARWTGAKIAAAYRWTKAKVIAGARQVARPFKWAGRHIAEAGRVTKKFLYELRFIGVAFRGIGAALGFVWNVLATIVKAVFMVVVFAVALIVGIVLGLVALVSRPFRKSDPRTTTVTNEDGSVTATTKFIFGSSFVSTTKDGKEIRREMRAKGGKVLTSTVITYDADGSRTETTSDAQGAVTITTYSAEGVKVAMTVNKKESKEDSFRGAQPGTAAA